MYYREFLLCCFFFLNGESEKQTHLCRTIELSDYRTDGLSGCQTIELTYYRTDGLSGCRTVGLTGCRIIANDSYAPEKASRQPR